MLCQDTASIISSPIQPLPREVVNLIAAGEVIDSIAAVVRELVENSLDAGATRIVISLLPDLWQVQVADNGRGMSLTDLRVCAKAHTTSKIRRRADLFRISSLGFRGEALHSLAQVSDLEIFSRPKSVRDAVGWRIAYQKGKPVAEEATAIASGTIVTVANLFGNLPVRRLGLPSMKRQLKAVQATIGQIALTHPGVTWGVLQNDLPWFNIGEGVSARDILPQILKQVRPGDLQLLKRSVPAPDEMNPPRSDGQKGEIGGEIELVLGLPDRCHRRRADWVKVAVNGRIVRAPELEQTIISGMSRTLPRDRYPVCFLHLQIPPSQIDWNRHPAKTAIYLHSIKYWQEQIDRAMEQALSIGAAHLPALQNQRVGQLLKAAEKKGAYHLSGDLELTSKKEKNTTNNDISLMELRAVAQVRNTYIVAEHPTGIWLVEQHIAHERVLYEQLLSYWRLVPLQTPIILSQLTSAQLEQLEHIGLDIESFGEQMWAVRNAPEMLHEREDCADALIELSLGGDLQEAQVATACRSAIRNGTPLTLEQMQTILQQWKNTRNPRTCPHGRPIYLSLEESALARFFRRHWVIGKSHGI